MKNLLPILLVLFSFSLVAQQNAVDQIHEHPGVYNDVTLKAKQAGPVNYYLSESPKIGHSTKQGQSVETLIGHSANIFTSVGEVRTVMEYNPEINTMTYLYRQDPAEYGNVGNSGWMRYSVSKDGGATWTENNGLVWDDINGTSSAARYPQGFLYNPPANTIADSARQVFFGPTLTGTNSASWGGLGFGSVKIGDAGATATDQVELNSTASTKYYIPRGGTAANDKIWVLDPVIDWSSGSGIYQDTLSVFVGTVANGAISFTRNAVYFPVDMIDGSPYSHQIAFGPDGQTGYIACIGRLDSITYPKNSKNIIHMKTTDGGATWSAPTEYYYADDTLITNNIGDSANATGPQCASAQFQLDLVVDTFGNPHTLMNIEWRPDTAAFGFTYVGRPSTMWHVYSPDGGASWDFNRVATTNLRYGIIGTGTGANAVQENRPSLSRDPNGRYVTMAWFDTDTALGINPTPCTGFGDPYCGNSDRYINTAAYNVVKDYYAPVVAWDFFLQGSYTSNFENIAEIAPFDGAEITIPYEYMKLDDKNDYLTPADHYYESGVTYTKEELGDTTTIGLRNASISADQLKLFPNPTNSELNIIISDSDLGNEVKVFNSLGQLVMRSAEYIKSNNNLIYKLDVSALNEGVYLVKMDNSNVSTRFIKQ